MDGEHITDTDYRDHGAANLMNYVERKKGYRLENRTGQEMSEDEKEIFEKKSDYYGFERQMMISPRDDCSRQEMAEATRDSVNRYFDGETVDYCYAVHEDEGHSHVILTGEKDDLYMNKSDIRDFNKESKRQFRKRRERSVEREMRRENGMDREQEKEQTSERQRQPKRVQHNVQ